MHENKKSKKEQESKPEEQPETKLNQTEPTSTEEATKTAEASEDNTETTEKDTTKKAEESNNKREKLSFPKARRNVPVGPGNFWNNILTTILILLLLTAGYSYLVENKEEPKEISISAIVRQVQEGEVKEIVVKGSELEVFYNDADRTQGVAKKETDAAVSETLANFGVTPEELSAVNIDVKKPTGFGYWAGTLAPFMFPILLLGIIIWFFTRSMKGAGMQAMSFGNSKARMTDPNDNTQKVTFKDVAGAKEAKEELEEIVDFLKNPKKFIEIGAEIPKGVMMMGAPGTGKTLLARAVAGEAGVPFFSISGSEFVEMFVGVGASRVRDLFQTAKKNAPAIIFVDEIDAVGRVRGTGVGGGNDEREQTLNQILVEMDGFEPNAKVIVMAATNRPDVLDPALLRPGRFDRRVTIDLPDRDDRRKILDVHARKKPLAEDVQLDIIAQRTPGFSGADLQSLMNEAAILAAREKRQRISQFDLIRSIEKVMLGPERRSHVLSQKEKKVTAYHEVGHALVASVLPYADPVQKISIISRGRAAGYTLKLPDQDRRMQTKKEFMDDIAMTLGGYVTEEMVFGDLTTGPSNDLQVVANLARDMVTKYGMGTLGPRALEGTGGRLIGGGSAEDRGYSQDVARLIDDEVARLIEEGKDKAREILEKYRPALDAISEQLIAVETLERPEYEALLKEYNVPIHDAYKEEFARSTHTSDPTKDLEDKVS